MFNFGRKPLSCMVPRRRWGRLKLRIYEYMFGRCKFTPGLEVDHIFIALRLLIAPPECQTNIRDVQLHHSYIHTSPINFPQPEPNPTQPTPHPTPPQRFYIQRHFIHRPLSSKSTHRRVKIFNSTPIRGHLNVSLIIRINLIDSVWFLAST